ncbi:hypothetical protein [Gordonia sp. ABSL49_1]|uniref:hypothetical protein n=1 Tax=Gordonia sp. ABSL49_1 TaxID=2920941 RepID=UPI001F0DA84B|nr:hypothetical protein [Gordonia sp. ABSL49_1]MCH5645575.1 hypothetical protein [Gordonia sp. ABSL49_1]
MLATLPDDMHVMTESVAAFYGVPKETVRTLVRNNRDEIEADGYRVVTRSAFEESFQTKLPSSASTIALFPRRAVLRVGMLLRDSGVARQVRDYLLAVEEVACDAAEFCRRAERGLGVGIREGQANGIV